MRRPPSTTSLGTLPPRYACRAGFGTFFGPQRCARSCSIIARKTCWPAVRQSPKNAVLASARTSSSGNGTWTVATDVGAGAFPADDPVRLLFMAASFRWVVVTPSFTGRRKEPPLLLQQVSSTGSGTSPLVAVGTVGTCSRTEHGQSLALARRRRGRS